MSHDERQREGRSIRPGPISAFHPFLKSPCGYCNCPGRGSAVARVEPAGLDGSRLCQRGPDRRKFAFVCSAVPASSVLQAIAMMGVNNLQGLCLTSACAATWARH